MKEIIKSKNWNDFKQNISGLSKKEKGDAFELLVKYYAVMHLSQVIKKVAGCDRICHIQWV